MGLAPSIILVLKLWRKAYARPESWVTHDIHTGDVCIEIRGLRVWKFFFVHFQSQRHFFHARASRRVFDPERYTASSLLDVIFLWFSPLVNSSTAHLWPRGEDVEGGVERRLVDFEICNPAGNLSSSKFKTRFQFELGVFEIGFDEGTEKGFGLETYRGVSFTIWMLAFQFSIVGWNGLRHRTNTRDVNTKLAFALGAEEKRPKTDDWYTKCLQRAAPRVLRWLNKGKWTPPSAVRKWPRWESSEMAPSFAWPKAKNETCFCWRRHVSSRFTLLDRMERRRAGMTRFQLSLQIRFNSREHLSVWQEFKRRRVQGCNLRI